MENSSSILGQLPDKWKPWVAAAAVVVIPGVVSFLIGLVVFLMSFNILAWME